jgi:uncharacterized membrane protein
MKQLPLLLLAFGLVGTAFTIAFAITGPWWMAFANGLLAGFLLTQALLAQAAHARRVRPWPEAAARQNGSHPNR